ncbi:MAG: HugZ family protein [Acidobacteriota bacterium]
MKANSDFDARKASRKLLHEGRSGALATLMPRSGDPYCSLVNVATDIDGAPLLLLSRLAVHTKNILADARVSLMLDERKESDPLEGARIMLMGRAEVSDAGEVRRRYLARHPDAEQYASFGDFAFYKMTIERIHLVAGFGRIVDLAPHDVLTDVSDCASLIEAEADAIAHMNADHADALRLYATKLLSAPDGEWRCVGLNPEGIEIQRGRDARWLPFIARVTTPMALRQVLKDLATRARAA